MLLLLLTPCLAVNLASPATKVGRPLGSRTDFPILHQEVWDGRPLVYLDSAATSQKPSSVIDAMRSHLERDNANVHRGAHLLAARSTESYEGARTALAEFVNANSRDEIVFTRGATEAINLVAQSWGAANLCEGDEVILTVMEHHSNLVPWQQLAAQRGVVLKFARLNASECLDLPHLTSLVSNRTKLISVAHVSNMLGCVAPVKEIVAAARGVGALVMLDACQSLPHMPVDVQALGVDFIAASGHKMLGPTGIGFLWGKHSILCEMPPWQGGGEMIDQVSLFSSTYMPPPARFEAGTPAITEAIGLAAAVRYLSDIGMEKVQAHEERLSTYLYSRMSELPELRLYGPDPRLGHPRAALCSFTSNQVHATDLATFLDQDGVAIRSGHHCTQPLHTELGLAASARASLYIYNTEEDVDALIASLRSTLDMFAELDS